MMLFVAPIVLGLGSFFVIPLVLLAVAMLPVAIGTGIVVLIVGWRHPIHRAPDDPRPHHHPPLPLATAHT